MVGWRLMLNFIKNGPYISSWYVHRIYHKKVDMGSSLIVYMREGFNKLRVEHSKCKDLSKIQSGL